MTLSRFRNLRSTGLCILLFALLTVSSFKKIYAQQEIELKDPGLTIQETRKDNHFSVWMMPPQLLEATVTIDYDEENMSTNRTSPFTLEVKKQHLDGSDAQLLLDARQADMSKAYSFYWHYHWNKGLRGGRPDATIYSLPIERGKSVRVMQGYLGKFSHGPGSQNEYAIDFDLSEGTRVYAAREGTVIAARADSNFGGPDLERFKNAANYVVIKHSDGTYGSYLHLKRGGVMLRLGDRVARGQVIGLAGATGAASQAHLHFDVSVPQDGATRVTFPVKFNTDKGPVTLIQNETYKNM